jgi:Skp family chaperone for outer membrane proteins
VDSVKNLKKIIIFILLIYVVLFIFSYGIASDNSKTYIGVVDIEKLLKVHKDWKKLEALDAKLDKFESHDVRKGSMAKLNKTAEKKFLSLMSDYDTRMKRKNDELSSSWGSKQDAIMGELESLQTQYQSVMEANMNPIKKKNEEKLLKAKEQLENEMAAKLDKEASKVREKYKPDIDKENQAIQFILDKYVSTLVAEKDKKLDEKRKTCELELESVLSSERNRLQSDIDDYKQKRLEENQSQLLRINLDLNKLNSQKSFAKEDQDKLKSLLQERDDISNAYDNDIASKNQEMEYAFNSFKEKKLKEIDIKLQGYNNDLTIDMKAKVEDKKNELDAILQDKIDVIENKVREEMKDFQESVQEQYAVLINQKQDEIEANAESQWSSINSQFGSEYEQRKNALIAELSLKQGQVKGEFTSYSKKIQKEFNERKKKLEEELYKTQEEFAKTEMDSYKKISLERKELFKNIMKDIGTKVNSISEARGISVVITGYWLNIDTVNLTDDVLKIMKN